jgi:hypothetical protein
MRRDDRAVETTEHVAGPQPFRHPHVHDVIRGDERLGLGNWLPVRNAQARKKSAEPEADVPLYWGMTPNQIVA